VWVVIWEVLIAQQEHGRCMLEAAGWIIFVKCGNLLAMAMIFYLVLRMCGCCCCVDVTSVAAERGKSICMLERKLLAKYFL